jgi:hypothetical protein
MASKDGVQKLVKSRRFSSIDGIKAVRHGSTQGTTNRLDFAKESKQQERVNYDDLADFQVGMFF